MVSADAHCRSPLPAGQAILRLLVVKHLSTCTHRETEDRVAGGSVLRWFRRIYVQAMPDFSTVHRWSHTIRREILHAANDRGFLAWKANVTRARKPHRPNGHGR